MKSQAYFTKGFFRFLTDLAANNERDWFLENKDRYETMVRQPSLQFIADVGPRLEKISPYIVADPRPSGGTLMRIYRDIRFSKDKSPYKTHVAFGFDYKVPGSEVHGPGLYLHLAPGQCFAGGGFWHPDNPTLAKIRQTIVANPKEWKKVVGKVDLHGEMMKRPPAGFPADHEFVEDLKKKDFIASTKFTQSQVCSADFISDFTAACKSIAPLLAFLAGAIGLPCQ